MTINEYQKEALRERYPNGFEAERSLYREVGGV